MSTAHIRNWFGCVAIESLARPGRPFIRSDSQHLRICVILAARLSCLVHKSSVVHCDQVLDVCQQALDGAYVTSGEAYIWLRG